MISNDKARAALEKVDNVAGVVIDKTITVMLKEDKPLDEEALAAAVKDHKIVITDTKKADALPF